MFRVVPAIFSLVLLPALCSGSNSAQVYLYPHSSSPALSDSLSESNALLAHHLRLESFEALPEKNLFGEVILGGAKTFVGEGAGDALLVSVDTNHPEDVIPEFLEPSFRLSTSSQSISTILGRYTHLAQMTYASVVTASLPSNQPPHRILDIFSLSTTSSSNSGILEKFLGSLSALVAFVEEVDGRHATEQIGVFEVKGLRDIEQEWGRQSELYLTAAKTLKATMQSAVSSHLSLAVLVPSSSLRTRQFVQPPQSPLPLPGVPDTAPIFSTSTCFTTANLCANATGGCSSRGQCVGVTRAGRKCYVCECGSAPAEEGGKNISWAGSMCQKKDISQEFTLIAGTVLFLIMVVFGSISLLYTVGDQELPGTLAGGVGGHAKLQ